MGRHAPDTIPRGVLGLRRPGRFPAIALDASKTPVATAASNLGHLLATGLLDAEEIAQVADRMRQPDLDSGYGLRTMSSESAGFNPLGYHTGSIWPHDTAIAIRGFARSGHGAVAASLAAGLLRAAAAFDHHLPELFGGSDARDGRSGARLPGGLPADRLVERRGHGARPGGHRAGGGRAGRQSSGSDPRPEFAAWFPLRVRGLRIAGHPLTIAVASPDRVTVETTAPLRIDAPG